jgi:hypothetical protein
VNPFRYGQVVRGDDFCPRPELVGQVATLIRSGQNVWVQGERRVGKTSLICEAAGGVRKRRMLYADLLEIKTSDDLCRRIVKALISLEREGGVLEKTLKSLAQLRPSISLDPLTGAPTITLDATARLSPESIDGLLDMIARMHRRGSLVVVLDEFQDILNLGDHAEALAILRGKIQFHGSIPYVFAGSVRSRMADIFTDPDSAFFKSATAIEVGPIDPTEFRRFIRRRFARGRRTLVEGTLARILAIANEVPGDVQQLCAALWETTSHRARISEKNIPEALELIFARESKGYEAALARITGQQLRCLVGLARMGGKAPLSKDFLRGTGIALPASVRRALTRLVALKIVYRQEGEYRLVNPFFGAWLVYKDF